MNRRRRIIVSLTGMTIILLALLGITYGYYLTRIQGNTNTNSISIMTSKLSLQYRENEDSNITMDKVEPGAKASKEFYITNNGNDTIYDYGVFLEDVINTFNRTEDIVYNLTCEVYQNDTKIGDCDGISSTYPTKNALLITNDIEVSTTHVYTLEIEYKYLDTIDQSEDMGKTLGGKVQIYALSDVVDITGTIVGYSNGDYVQIESDPKTSVISQSGKYTLVGVMPGNHTLKVMSSSGQVKTSKSIKIQKQEVEKIEDNVISINNNSETVNIDINVGTNNFTISKPLDYNPNNGILALNYGSGRNINLTTNKSIDDSEIKTDAIVYPFSITNVSDEHQKITIKLTDIEIDDALKDIDFRWGLYNADTDIGLSFGFFKNIGDKKEITVYEDFVIDVGESARNYKLRIWIHDDGANQTYLYNKTFKAKLVVEGIGVEYTPEECFTFETGTITDYNVSCGGTDVVIPKTIEGQTVASVTGYYSDDGYDYAALADKGLTSLIIPNTITSIYYYGDNTITRGNYYTKLTIPESITNITNGFAADSGLTRIFIPETVTSIGESSFSNSSLEELVIPGSVNSIGTSAFGIPSKNSGNLSSLVLMNGLETIGDFTFIGNKFYEIEIPSSVNSIGYSNFRYYDDIYNDDIYNSNLTKIIVRGKTSVSDFVDASGLTGEYALPEGVTVEYRP